MTLMAFLSTTEHLGWPFTGFLFLDWEKCLGRINELLHLGRLDEGAFIWPELFLLRGAGAGLIRDRPAAAVSLAERLVDPRCLIGTDSLLTRVCTSRGKECSLQ